MSFALYLHCMIAIGVAEVLDSVTSSQKLCDPLFSNPPEMRLIHLHCRHNSCLESRKQQATKQPLSRRSKSVWKNTCHPILAAAGLTLEVVETQRPQHAFSIAQSTNLKETAAIGCVGGDGTMSEILQV